MEASFSVSCLVMSSSVDDLWNGRGSRSLLEVGSPVGLECQSITELTVARGTHGAGATHQASLAWGGGKVLLYHCHKVRGYHRQRYRHRQQQ